MHGFGIFLFGLISSMISIHVLRRLVQVIPNNHFELLTYNLYCAEDRFKLSTL